MKAKLIKLTSGYEHGLVAGTGRLKRDYIGLTGEILRKRCYKSDLVLRFVFDGHPVSRRSPVLC